MFGIGSSELLIILVVALLVLGPEHLPKIMRTVGKVMGDFRRITTDFQRTINTEVAVDEEKRIRREEKKAKQAAKEAARAELLAELKAEAEAKEAGLNSSVVTDKDETETQDSTILKDNSLEEKSNKLKTSETTTDNSGAV
ncbi:Sec-independent protein translocase protein TatB [Desulfovibrio litoralis]|uniref:Sec-independent protein translocase protein TatB homolog n=1 Tax=Desulfovibrio litoralis DSM 11393 TaxID=1121455 RepID=A0A1M7ST75_9BACT|nr:Sec-independent protein translocase protein TatB [Desulfovibrio litoralis]SHN61679.1 sec-independent protein translocase protein TatB [Desulfovibrio litoralis DSM 11393]